MTQNFGQCIALINEIAACSAGTLPVNQHFCVHLHRVSPLLGSAGRQEVYVGPQDAGGPASPIILPTRAAASVDCKGKTLKI